jgi:hypothetical protein
MSTLLFEAAPKYIDLNQGELNLVDMEEPGEEIMSIRKFNMDLDLDQMEEF